MPVMVMVVSSDGPAPPPRCGEWGRGSIENSLLLPVCVRRLCVSVFVCVSTYIIIKSSWS